MKLLLKQYSLVFIVLLFVSCSEKQILIPSEVIIGEWETTNLSDFNARLKLDHDEAHAPEIEPFDPVTRIRVTYNIDGTGHSEAVYKHQPIFQNNFSYRFVARNEYESATPKEPDSHELFIEVVNKSRVLNLEKNKITIMLIGSFHKGKERSTIEAIENPLPLSFVRLTKD